VKGIWNNAVLVEELVATAVSYEKQYQSSLDEEKSMYQDALATEKDLSSGEKRGKRIEY